MTRGRAIAIGASAIVVLVLALLGILRLTSPGHSALAKYKNRKMLMVLVPVSGNCKLVTVYGERAYRQETVEWRVFDACGFNTSNVRLRFTGVSNSGYHDPGTAEIEGSLRPNHETQLTLNNIRNFTGQPPVCSEGGDPNDTCWWFQYVVEVEKTPGRWTAIADPRLEVDP